MKLRRLLREVPIPDEHEARQRSLAVVHAAYAAREPTPPRSARPAAPSSARCGRRSRARSTSRPSSLRSRPAAACS